jgi:hypothetical protein
MLIYQLIFHSAHSYHSNHSEAINIATDTHESGGGGLFIFLAGAHDSRRSSIGTTV